MYKYYEDKRLREHLLSKHKNEFKEVILASTSVFHFIMNNKLWTSGQNPYVVFLQIAEAQIEIDEYEPSIGWPSGGRGKELRVHISRLQETLEKPRAVQKQVEGEISEAP